MIVLIRLLINSLAIYIAAQIIPGVELGGLLTALVVAVMLGLVNTFIRPILLFFTLPLNILTLGLLTFVINAAMVLLVDYFVKDFQVSTLFTALVFSILVSLVSSFLVWIAK